MRADKPERWFKMYISLSNAKLGDKIPSFNLPAILTCRADAPCKKNCYACKGNWRFSNVQNALKGNLDAFMNDPEGLEKFITEWINNGDCIYRFFRWFSSGDIVNARFFEMMVRIAQNSPATKFLAFTKKFNIVNDYIKNGGTIPENLHIIFSGWGKAFKVENPYNLPVAYVELKNEENDIPEYAIPCVGSCKNCKSCWALHNGQAVYFKQH